MLGGVWAAMVLGHWYLVTPRLPEAPLVRISRLSVQPVAEAEWRIVCQMGGLG